MQITVKFREYMMTSFVAQRRLVDQMIPATLEEDIAFVLEGRTVKMMIHGDFSSTAHRTLLSNFSEHGDDFDVEEVRLTW